MVLARFPTLASLINNPMLHPGFASGCDAFAEPQPAFLEACGRPRIRAGKTPGPPAGSGKRRPIERRGGEGGRGSCVVTLWGLSRCSAE